MRAVWAGALCFFAFAMGAYGQALVVNEDVNLNLRRGPGTDYAVMDRAGPGEVLQQVGRDGVWLQTSRGWAHSDFVTAQYPLVAPSAPAVRVGVNSGLIDSADQVALSPDGRILATHSQLFKIIQFWDYRTGEFLAEHEYTQTLAVERSHNILPSFLSNDRVAVYSPFGDMLVLDTPSMTEIYHGPTLFGYVAGSTDAYIISQLKEQVYLHDPVTLEAINSFHLYRDTEFEVRAKVSDGELDQSYLAQIEALEFFKSGTVLGHFITPEGEANFYAMRSGFNGNFLEILDSDGNVIDSRNVGDIVYTRIFHQAGRAHGYTEVDDERIYAVYDLADHSVIREWAAMVSNTEQTFSGLDGFIVEDDQYKVSPDGRYYVEVQVDQFTEEPPHLVVTDMNVGDTRAMTLPDAFEAVAASHMVDNRSIIVSSAPAYGSGTSNASRFELWKVDLERALASNEKRVSLTEEHPAVTVYRRSETGIRPVEVVAEDTAGQLRLEAPDGQLFWFDPRTMSASSDQLADILSAVLSFRDTNGMLTHIVGNPSRVQPLRQGGELDHRALSTVLGEVGPDSFFNDLEFSASAALGPEVIPTRIASSNWNVPFVFDPAEATTRTVLFDSEAIRLSGADILQDEGGGLYALDVAADPWGTRGLTADVSMTTPELWPEWRVLDGIDAITPSHRVFSGDWIRTKDGRAFLGSDEEGRPGTYFINTEHFVPFDDHALRWIEAEATNPGDPRGSLTWELTPVFMGDGNLVVLPSGLDCAGVLYVSTQSGESHVLTADYPEPLCGGHFDGPRPQALDGDRLIANSAGTAWVIDIASGEALLEIPSVSMAAASMGGRHIFAVRESGLVDVLDGLSGETLVTFYVLTDGSWIVMTSEGFYASGGEGEQLLQVSQGLRGTFSIDRFRDELFRPDLVAEALNGDPEGLVRAAAQTISLERILLSGSAPVVDIEGERDGAVFNTTASISDSGGGIGRLEWRVNGVTQQTSDGLDTYNAELHLAEGDNRIELVAYNQDNTIQSRSNAVHVTVESEELGKPRLYILAMGIDDYAQESFALRYAVNDATALADNVARAGNGLYSEIFTHMLTDDEVTRENLEQTFASLARTIRPNDVFVFFSAGHGVTIDGRYFFIPQDFTGSTMGEVREHGIGHAQWQEWFSTIPAQKSLLLFDTCQSGSLAESLVGRDLRFRSATDFLGNATGRALLSASSSTELAWEGFEGHGVFTYSILEALKHADLDENGVIDITELASVIQRNVPEIAAQVWNERQTPQFKAPQLNFAVTEPLPETL